MDPNYNPYGDEGGSDFEEELCEIDFVHQKLEDLTLIKNKLNNINSEFNESITIKNVENFRLGEIDEVLEEILNSYKKLYQTLENIYQEKEKEIENERDAHEDEKNENFLRWELECQACHLGICENENCFK